METGKRGPSRREVVIGLAAAAVVSNSPMRAWAAPPLPMLDFLKVSSILTGIPVEGSYIQIADKILNGLDVDQAALKTLARRLEKVPLGAGSREIDRALNRSTRPLARRIAKAWYTGKVERPEGTEKVITYDDALVWQACDFTKPPTTCGGPFGYWNAPYTGGN